MRMINQETDEASKIWEGVEKMMTVMTMRTMMTMMTMTTMMAIMIIMTMMTRNFFYKTIECDEN